MSVPSKPIARKLIIGILYRKQPLELLVELKGLFGEYAASKPLEFTFTKYYEKEFGLGLKRIFLIFKDAEPRLVEDKLKCSGLEASYGSRGKRLFNIDSGYLSANSLVLASFKPRPHRIYLEKGVYADLQLVYEEEDWKDFAWTFPDISANKGFFDAQRILIS